jgi:hypothetical protein
LSGRFGKLGANGSSGRFGKLGANGSAGRLERPRYAEVGPT